MALILEYNNLQQTLQIQGYSLPQGEVFTSKEKRNAYISDAINYSDVPDEDRSRFSKFLMGTYKNRSQGTEMTEDAPIISVFASKKYKPGTKSKTSVH